MGSTTESSSIVDGSYFTPSVISAGEAEYFLPSLDLTTPTNNGPASTNAASNGKKLGQYAKNN